jgi:hypothetical protein
MYRFLYYIMKVIWLIPKRNTFLLGKLISILLLTCIYIFILFPLNMIYKIKNKKRDSSSNSYYKIEEVLYDSNSFKDTFF